MKRLYTRIIAAQADPEAETNPRLTRLLAAFLFGVLCTMFIQWLLF